MKFAVLTGGGDSPGMNAFVRAIVRVALNLKSTTTVWGVIDGWRGLADNNYRKLAKRDTAGKAIAGGTILGTLRLPELKDDVDMQETIAINLHDEMIDYLFIIGGNGSLAAANVINKALRKKNLNTKVLVAPGSIDNDVCNKYGFSVGFYSAVDKSIEMLEWIRDTASSHRRVYLIESMGRDSGFLSFYAGIATGAEYTIRPGENVDFDRIATMIDERDRDTRIIVSEGYEMKVDEIKIHLDSIFQKRNIRHEIRTVDMGYFQRGGKAAVKDILLASWLGYNMVKDAYAKCESGYYSAFNIGQPPTILPLEVAAEDPSVNSMEIPKEIIEFALALR
jgi:6-phosphofructokinase 1